MLKRIDGRYKNSYNNSNAVLVEHGKSQFLLKLADMSKTPVAAGTMYLETRFDQLIAIETIENDHSTNKYRIASDNFRTAWWSAPSNNPILQFWIIQQTEIDWLVLVQYEDLQLAMYDVKSKDK